MKEIINEKSHSNDHQNVLKQCNSLQKNLNDDDLQTYWSQFLKYIPNSTIDLWDAMYKMLRCYYKLLVGKLII